MTSNKSLNYYTDILQKKVGELPTNFTVLLLEPGKIIVFESSVGYSYHNQLITGENVHGDLIFSREDLLEMFTKLEFFLREILKVNISQDIFDVTTVPIIYSTLTRLKAIDVVNILHENKLIDPHLRNSIIELLKVRNQIAHNWSMDGLTYKGQILTEYVGKGASKRINPVWRKFNTDSHYIWNELFKCYAPAQNNIKIQIERLYPS